MKKLVLLAMLCGAGQIAMAQTTIAGALASYNESTRGKVRLLQYVPDGDAFVSESTLDDFLQGRRGANRFTRALYGSHTDWRLETSDRPIFAVAKKGHHRSIRFVVDGVSLDSVDYCRSAYRDGTREYLLSDHRWAGGMLHLTVVALPHEEGAVWNFIPAGFGKPMQLQTRICQIANPKLKRNGDIGADAPGVFEPSKNEKGLVVTQGIAKDNGCQRFVVVRLDEAVDLPWQEAERLFDEAVTVNHQLAGRLSFHTPNAYVNALATALVFAADGDWDGQTWLHGCIGWRMPLAGWRAAYVGDVLGWNDRSVSHFDAYAKSQVTDVEPVIPHPSQDPQMNMARAEKRWGTQMYSNGYICRNPEKNNQMHHYDMNLNYMDELLWHFQYDADTAYMRRMWPVIERHLAWERRNYDPDGDHLYDAYCCIWASDALYYSGGAVTHSSAYNYRGNKLAARIAEIIGEDPQPYRDEAEAILNAMNERLWMKDKGVWAEFQDAMGLKRLHESPAVWSIYTPIDCGACSQEQAWQATEWVMSHIPHITIDHSPLTIDHSIDSAAINVQCSTFNVQYKTIATSNWMPYSWSINNVAAAEVMHTALAFFEAGHSSWGYELLMGNVMDQMYYGQSPANFGQLSHYDAARGECYRDFGDCIGIASRTLIQGLFGIIPQALDGRCIIRPGFPRHWDSVAIKTPYLEYRFTRKGGVERYEITQHFRQPLKIVVRQNCGQGLYLDTEGTSEEHQLIEVKEVRETEKLTHPIVKGKPVWGTDEPDLSKPFTTCNISKHFNSEVDDIFKNRYVSPRPQTTTLQIPVQGVGEWCHPQYTPDINDSVFRTLIADDRFVVAGVPFATPKAGKNIVYTSLWDNYPDSVVIPLKGKASAAWLLMAGSTNHMQSRIDNGLVVATYKDGTADTLLLRNPDNWCPIEQDYFVDGKAFYTATPRPYRVSLGTGVVSRNLGEALKIKGVYGREIKGGAAQMLRMQLNPQKKLKSLTLRTLSNDVVIGLMAVTLQ